MRYPEESVDEMMKLRRFYGLLFLKLTLYTVAVACVGLVLTQLLLAFLWVVSVCVSLYGVIFYICYRVDMKTVVFHDVDDANGFIASR